MHTQIMFLTLSLIVHSNLKAQKKKKTQNWFELTQNISVRCV